MAIDIRYRLTENKLGVYSILLDDRGILKMPDAYMNGLNKHCWIGWLVLLGLFGGVCGCALIGTDVPEDNRTCDVLADAVVASEQWQQAVKSHEQVLNKDPSNCLAMYHMGYIWGRLDDPSKEVEWYNNAINCGHVRNDELYFNLGMAYADMGQIKKAIDAFKRAVRLRPDKAENHYGLAIALKAEGDAVGAEQALIQAIAVSPSHWDARLLLARIYLDQGRLEAARPHLELVIQQDPENEAVKDLYRLYEDRRITSYDN